MPDVVEEAVTPGPVPRPLRVRFAPAPSGDLHVGNVRTALYNWALARRHEGSFVFRVEDTDRSRATTEAYHAAQEVLTWLGLDWDEGPGVGGPFAPYRQSERLEVYAGILAQLLEQGAAYPCYCSKEELEERAARARAEKRPPGYDGHCRDLSPEQIQAYEDGGRTAAVRFRMPPGVTSFVDLVRGEVVFDHSLIPDFALTRSDGHPLYLLAAGVDDVLMGITHIVRGEDLLSAVPRQLALYAALGVRPEDVPQFGHLPLITGDDGKPLSKRNGETSVAWYRAHGFTPEALVNYLTLLGWSLSGDRELFEPAEMVAAFSLDRVSRNPARFDLRKLEAINGDKIRALSEDELAARLLPLMQEAGLIAASPTEAEVTLLRQAVPMIQTKLDRRLTQAPELLAFAFTPEESFVVDSAAAEKALTAAAGPTLAAALASLEMIEDFAPAAVQEALDAALLDGGLGLKRGKAYAPLRVAVTGRTVSPGLPESIALIGRDRALRRLRVALAALPAS